MTVKKNGQTYFELLDYLRTCLKYDFKKAMKQKWLEVVYIAWPEIAGMESISFVFLYFLVLNL